MAQAIVAVLSLIYLLITILVVIRVYRACLAIEDISRTVKYLQLDIQRITEKMSKS